MTDLTGETGLDRIDAYYSDLQSTCPHLRGFWSEDGSMCLNCHARNVVLTGGDDRS
jgi:hypothetical protein